MVGRRNKKRIALGIAAIAGLAIPMGAALILFLVHGGKHTSTDMPDTPIRTHAPHADTGSLPVPAYSPTRPAPAVALDTRAGVVFALGNPAPRTAPPTTTGDIASGGEPHTGSGSAPGAGPRTPRAPSTSGGGTSADPTRIAYGPSGGGSGGGASGDTGTNTADRGDGSEGNTDGGTQDAPGNASAPTGDAPQRTDTTGTPADKNAPDGGNTNTPPAPNDERVTQDTAAPDNAPDAHPATAPTDQAPGSDAPRNQPSTTAPLPLDPLLRGAAPQFQALTGLPQETIHTVPEPSAIALVLAGIGGLSLTRKMMKKGK